VSEAKAENVQRVVAKLVEGRIGETVDNGENGCGNEAQENWPEGGNAPVLSSCDYDVEISSELLALF
jgi:hypothetical protein